jgi:hypothetical protein
MAAMERSRQIRLQPVRRQRRRLTAVITFAAALLLLPAFGAAPARALPAFESSISPIGDTLRQRMIDSGSWKPGCPVAIEKLRLVKMTFFGFDGEAHTGRLVVHQAVATDVVTVFRKLYRNRFAIHRMRLIDAYGANDRRSMRADNTSAFNGRFVAGTTTWSRHAYGKAIDISPVENPWVWGSDISPAAGAAFVNRSQHHKGMIHAGGLVVRAFAAIGWKWGGDWSPYKDYMHFSSNGQ